MPLKLVVGNPIEEKFENVLPERIEMGQYTESLKKTELFQNLSDVQLEVIESIARSGSIAAGNYLIQEDDLGQSMYLVVEGRVDVHMSIPNSEQSEVIATLKAGDVVGELVLLGRARRSAHVTAKDNVKALVWKSDELSKVLSENLEIGYIIMSNLAALLATRLTATNLALRNVLTAPKTIML